LRDGTRLVRLAEVLSLPQPLAPLSLCRTLLRFPAPSRTNKLHNVTAGLKELSTRLNIDYSGPTPAATAASKHRGTRAAAPAPAPAAAPVFKPAARKSFIGRRSIFSKRPVLTSQLKKEAAATSSATAANVSVSAPTAAAQQPLSTKGTLDHVTTAVPVAPRDVVDGHQDKTLELLWVTLSHARLGSIVDCDRLAAETRAVAASCAAASVMLSLTAAANSPAATVPGTLPTAATISALLLRWCQAVCACYGVRVYDWSRGFADGR
jgi:hypothetical protein